MWSKESNLRLIEGLNFRVNIVPPDILLANFHRLWPLHLIYIYIEKQSREERLSSSDSIENGKWLSTSFETFLVLFIFIRIFLFLELFFPLFLSSTFHMPIERNILVSSQQSILILEKLRKHFALSLPPSLNLHHLATRGRTRVGIQRVAYYRPPVETRHRFKY